MFKYLPVVLIITVAKLECYNSTDRNIDEMYGTPWYQGSFRLDYGDVRGPVTVLYWESCKFQYSSIM